MLIYKFNILLISVSLLFAIKAGAETTEKNTANEESIFDFADNPDESGGNSPFDNINSGAESASDQNISGYYNSAKVIVINKITSKSRQITVEISKSSFFDNIELKLYKCRKSSDPYIPNNQLMLSIIENKFDEDPKPVFEGWLISSEPALSTFEHPVYEVLASDCTGSKVE